MGGQLKVDWQESADELKHLYQREVHPRRRTRLQALWQLRLGKRPDWHRGGGLDRGFLSQGATVAPVVSASWAQRSLETGGRASGER